VRNDVLKELEGKDFGPGSTEAGIHLAFRFPFGRVEQTFSLTCFSKGYLDVHLLS
jgi:hypothetical protein